MAYIKPKITFVGQALAAIQSVSAKDDIPTDGPEPQFDTSSAYEADE